MSLKGTNEQKVHNSKKLLKEIITTPADFLNNDKLLTSLKSQGLFAKLELSEFEISPCSL